MPLFDTSIADRPFPKEENFKFDNPIFNAKQVEELLLKLFNDKSFHEAIMTMKIAAVAAGGATKAEMVVRQYYVNALTLKSGQTCVENLNDRDYFDKSRSTGVIKCFCSALWITAIVLFVLIAGFPGLLHTEKFATHYQFLSK